MLIDKYGRQINYLRLSVTDRCNFRCYYCMPEDGVSYASRHTLLSFDEMYNLVLIFCSLGINKIRITGGEPFARPGIMDFLQRLSDLETLTDISITTNGTIMQQHLPALAQLNIRNINISLDALERQRFRRITRRDRFEDVYAGIFKLLNEGFNVKINCVVSEVNAVDILSFVELTRNHNLSVRFLEEMPFNGSNQFHKGWSYKKVYEHINNAFPVIEKLNDEKHSTSLNYCIPGYKGNFGLIPSFSRTFCGTCNRIRLSATGELRTCLYGPPSANLKEIICSGASVDEIKNVLLYAVSQKLKDGFAAEKIQEEPVHQSMSAIGG